KMRDVLGRPAAFGDMLDDVDAIAGCRGLIADDDARRGDETAALGLALPAMLVDEQAVAGFQRPLGIGGDPLRHRPIEQLERSPADDLAARQAELVLCDL